MNTLKGSAIRLMVLLVLPSPWLGASHAQTPSSEFSKQEAIYQSKGEQVPAGYSIDRSLAEYTLGLGAEFARALAHLSPQDRWLDVGAGQGRAMLDYYAPAYDAAHPEGQAQRGKKAKAIAISIEDRRTPAWQQVAASLEANQMQYFFGRRLREYSLAELGKFQMLTDVLGGFSYSQNLSRFMENALGFLEVGGSFYTVLQDVRSENGANQPHYPDARFLTEVVNADAVEVKICSWLKSITCVEVSCELKTGWRPPIEAYRINKVCDNVTVPALTATHFEAGTPPERRYRLANPLPASVERDSTVR